MRKMAKSGVDDPPGQKRLFIFFIKMSTYTWVSEKTQKCSSLWLLAFFEISDMQWRPFLQHKERIDACSHEYFLWKKTRFQEYIILVEQS